MVCVIRLDGRGLVRGLRKDIAEAAAAVDDGLAGFLWCGDAGAGNYLRGANSGDIRTGCWKGGVEGSRASSVVGAACAFGPGAALATITGNSGVTGGVENRDALHAEFHIFIALAYFVSGREVGFVVTVRGRDDSGSAELSTVFALVAAAIGIGVDAVTFGRSDIIKGIFESNFAYYVGLSPPPEVQ